MPDGADETIITRLVVESSEAIRNAQLLREEVEKAKAQMKDLSITTKQTFADIAVGMKEAAKASKELLVDPEMQRRVQQAIPIALKEVRSEEAALAKDRIQAARSTAEAEKQATAQQAAAIKQREAQTKQNIALQKELEKQLTTEKKKAIQEATAAQREYTQVTSQGYGVMSAAAQQYGKHITDIKTQIQATSKQTGQTFQQVGQQLVRSGMPVKDINQALKELNKESGNLAESFGFLGTVGKFVFGVVLGITGISVIRNLVRFMKEATQSGYEFARSLFQLEVGIRAIRRTGVEITFQDVIENIGKLRKEFGIFTTKELIVGSATLLNLVRDMGFTEKQIFSLQRAITTLAVVNGRAMDDVQRTVALAISSGYTEGLQRLGVSINRVTIAEKAAQLGWEGGYTALTEQQRAYSTYILILEKTRKYQDDLLQYQRTLPGRIDKTTASIQQQKDAIGLLIYPLKLIGLTLVDLGFRFLAFINPILAIAKGLRTLGLIIGYVKEQGSLVAKLFSELARSSATISRGFTLAQKAIDLFLTPFRAIAYYAPQIARGINEIIGISDSLISSMNKIAEVITSAKDSAISFVNDFIERFPLINKIVDNAINYFSKLKDIWVGIPIEETFPSLAPVGEAIDAEAEKIADTAEQLGNDIIDIQEEFAQRRLDIESDLWKDLEEINQDGARRREELERDLARRIEQINLNASRDRSRAQRDLDRDIAEIGRDTARREEELRARQRERELEDERQFQRRMRELREEFLLDLEEAVRARDAKAIRRLTRRFNLDRDQLIRQHEEEQRERRRDFQRELEELRLQAQQRKQERYIEFQQRLEDIRIQQQQELAEARARHQEELEDLRRQLAEQRAERIKRYQEQLRDLALSIQRRLEMLAKGLTREYQTTTTFLAALYKALYAYLGPNGYIDELYKYIAARAASTNLAPNLAPPEVPTSGGGFQRGGSFLATRPVSVMFGEENIPELVNVIPLIGRRGLENLTPITSRGGMGSGKLSLELFLSPDLEYRIMENTLGEFDKILVSVQRSRR